MATITNRSNYAVSVTGPGMPRDATAQEASDAAASAFSTMIEPGESAEVPDEIAKDWMGRPGVNAYIVAGAVIVKLDGRKPKPKPRAPSRTPTQPPAEPDAAPAAEPNEVEAFRAMHWKSALALVEKMDNADELEALHAAEERPRVKGAIEERMKQLNDGGE